MQTVYVYKILIINVEPNLSIRLFTISLHQINFYQQTYIDIDYSNFIAKLNNVITSYTKLIKTRETQRQNKKFKAQEDAKASWEEINKKENIEKN